MKLNDKISYAILFVLFGLLLGMWIIPKIFNLEVINQQGEEIRKENYFLGYEDAIEGKFPLYKPERSK